MDTDLFDEFTEQTGIRVNYSTYESNEAMYTKLRSGSVNYDVIIPSDYMISRLIDEGMLMKLDFDQIPNYANIDEQYRNMIYDPNNEYSVPYTWGTTGIIYNPNMVQQPITKWADLFDEEKVGTHSVLMFDNSRDCIAIALRLWATILHHGCFPDYRGCGSSGQTKAGWHRAGLCYGSDLRQNDQQ